MTEWIMLLYDFITGPLRTKLTNQSINELKHLSHCLSSSWLAPKGAGFFLIGFTRQDKIYDVSRGIFLRGI